MIWKIAAAIVILYLVLAVFPGILSYFIIFSRKEGTPLSRVDLAKTRFACCSEEIKAGFAFLENEKSETLKIEKDGVRLCCDYYDYGSPKTALLFHGYRSTPENNFFALAPFLQSLGYNIALVHERGHKKSGGKYIGVGLLERDDLLAWTAFFAKKEGQESLLLCGTSMGASTIAYASDKLFEASEGKVSGLVLDCGFVSVYGQISRDCVTRHIPPYGIMPVIALCARLHQKINIKEKTTDHLQGCKIPAFFMHGEKDETVPPEECLKNYEAHGGKKEIFIAENSYHAQAFSLGGEKLKEQLKTFLENSEKDGE